MASRDLAEATLRRVMSDIDSHGGALLPYSSSTVTVTTSPLGPSQLRLTPPVQTSRGVFHASQSQSSHNESEGLDALYAIVICSGPFGCFYNVQLI